MAKFFATSLQKQTSQTGAKIFVKIFAISSRHPKLEQFLKDKDDDFTEIARHFNIPQWGFDKTMIATSLKLPFIFDFPSGIILLKIPVIKNFSQQDNTCQEIFPTSGITRITFYLWKSPVESLSEIYCQEARTIRVSQQNHYSKACNLHLEKLPSPMVSTHHSFNNSILLFQDHDPFIQLSNSYFSILVNSKLIH